MKIVKERQHHDENFYCLNFWFVDPPNSCGFSFDCDENGNVTNLTNEAAKAHYAACLTGLVQGQRVLPGKIQKYTQHYSTPAIGLCEMCGRKVCLDGFTNTCQCGADYNMSGQRLAPRSQWGEETGESLADILSIP